MQMERGLDPIKKSPFPLPTFDDTNGSSPNEEDPIQPEQNMRALNSENPPDAKNSIGDGPILEQQPRSEVCTVESGREISDDNTKTLTSSTNDGAMINTDITNQTINLIGTDYSKGVILALQKENENLKEKIAKLKNLLSRSASASKTVITELNATKGKFSQANATIARLTMRCENLANRPTHLDLLANFEARFDAAVLSIEKYKEVQSGIEDSGDASLVALGLGQNTGPHSSIDDLNERQKISNELYEAKSRIDVLFLRAAKLEKSNETLLNEREAIDKKCLSMQDEIRSRVQEEENLRKQLQSKAWELEEMQMEIDLVTKASLDANVRATESMKVLKAALISKDYVNQLEQKASAMEEWALASAEAKCITINRCVELEKKLITLSVIWNKSSSLVVGAGDSVSHLVELGDISLPTDPSLIVLRYKLDISPADSDIVFSIFKGTKREKNSIVVNERKMHGGGAGDIDGVFDTDKTCSLLFCNRHSWIRPRTVKFQLQALNIK